MVVGASRGCTYTGYLYFNVDALQPQTHIIHATLYLNTPSQKGAIGLQIEPNSKAPDGLLAPLSWLQPSRLSAPWPAISAPHLTEDASISTWHTWDVTALVQRWIAQSETNGGLSITSHQPPIVIASALGTGTADATIAPYLKITR